MNLALSLEAFSDLQHFSEDNLGSSKEPFDLAAAPVLLHLEVKTYLCLHLIK